MYTMQVQDGLRSPTRACACQLLAKGTEKLNFRTAAQQSTQGPSYTYNLQVCASMTLTQCPGLCRVSSTLVSLKALFSSSVIDSFVRLTGFMLQTKNATKDSAGFLHVSGVISVHQSCRRFRSCFQHQGQHCGELSLHECVQLWYRQEQRRHLCKVHDRSERSSMGSHKKSG